MNAFCGRSTTCAVVAIRHSKAKRIQHMPRHREAEKSCCDDYEDHEREDLLHEPLLDQSTMLAADEIHFSHEAKRIQQPIWCGD